MTLALLVFAAIVYAVAGLFMKTSEGATRLGPTLTVLVLFSIGALAQARGMRGGDLSTSYLLVLGLEAIAAGLLGTLYLQEALTVSRLAAMLLIVVGVGWLRLA